MFVNRGDVCISEYRGLRRRCFNLVSNKVVAEHDVKHIPYMSKDSIKEAKESFDRHEELSHMYNLTAEQIEEKMALMILGS